MKRKIVVTLSFVFALTLAAVFLPTLGSPAQAQQSCPEIRGVIQLKQPGHR